MPALKHDTVMNLPPNKGTILMLGVPNSGDGYLTYDRQRVLFFLTSASSYKESVSNVEEEPIYSFATKGI